MSSIADLFKDVPGWAAFLGILVPGIALGYWARRVAEPEPQATAMQRDQARGERDEALAKLEETEGALGGANERLKRFDAIKDALFGDEDELWKLRGASPPDRYTIDLAESRAKIVTVANLKGGVGKTTITANLSAYFEHVLGLRVLLIDLDYQGSLSQTFMNATGQPYNSSIADDFIAGERTGDDLVKRAKSLHPLMPNSAIVTSDYSLQRTENRAMLRWLLQETSQDVRFNLGRSLLHHDVQAAFDIVLIDAPPRLTTAAINAVACSHYLIVPTIPDQTSSAAVGRFAKFISSLKSELNPALQIAGVVVNLSDEATLKAYELDAIGDIKDDLKYEIVNSKVYETNIPQLTKIQRLAGQKIAYFEDMRFREAFMDPLGAEIADSVGVGVMSSED